VAPSRPTQPGVQEPGTWGAYMKTSQIADQAEKIKRLLNATERASTDDDLRNVFKEYNLSYADTDTTLLSAPLGGGCTRMALDRCSSVVCLKQEQSKVNLKEFDRARVYNMFLFVTKSLATTGAYFHFLSQTVFCFKHFDLEYGWP